MQGIFSDEGSSDWHRAYELACHIETEAARPPRGFRLSDTELWEVRQSILETLLRKDDAERMGFCTEDGDVSVHALRHYISSAMRWRAIDAVGRRSHHRSLHDEIGEGRTLGDVIADDRPWLSEQILDEAERESDAARDAALAWIERQSEPSRTILRCRMARPSRELGQPLSMNAILAGLAERLDIEIGAANLRQLYRRRRKKMAEEIGEDVVAATMAAPNTPGVDAGWIT